MTDVLIYGDTFRSPELRHEVPLGIPDPFLYVERAGAKHIAIGAMEIARLEALGLFELHPAEEYGSDGLIAEGPFQPRCAAKTGHARCGARPSELGVTSAIVPRTSRSGSPTSCAPPVSS